VKAVIGLGFGDEGKGTVVAFLSSQNPLATVVRFSGGHQAGHTVVKDGGLRHIFSNFGSGTLTGNRTYISKYCLVSPVNLCNELVVLNQKGIIPTITIDDECMITTPYDFYYNRMNKETQQHGTCGMGIGSTVARNEAHYTLTFADLKIPSIFNIKMNLIRQYYKFPEPCTIKSKFDMEVESFKLACEILVNKIHAPMKTHTHPNDMIFEGSQGLLLDQNIGFFPHVTRSNTGSKNITAIMGHVPEYWLVTRAYQTRHGNGPMTNTEKKYKIESNPNETNITNEYQGEFRRSMLDLDLLKYGLDKDENICRNNLVITCIDHLKENYSFTYNNKIVVCPTKEKFANAIKEILFCLNVYISDSEEFKNIRKVGK